MAEAAAQFQKGLDQLALLPDNPDRQQQELEFFCALGAVLEVAKGFAAPETGQAYASSRKLWEELGAPVEFLRVPFGQSVYHMNRGELDLALRCDEDLLRVSSQRNDATGLAMAHQSFGRNLLFSGRFVLSRSHLEEATALCDPISYRWLAHKSATGTSPQVASQAFLGNVLLCLGYPDRALASSDAAIADARRLNYPPSLALSLSIGARQLSLVGDKAALDVRACELMTVAIDQGFPYWRALATAFRGWVMVKNGDVSEGISLLRSGSAAYRATGSEAWMCHIMILLAAAYEVAGEIEEGLTVLDESRQIVERTGERWLEAELNRHTGELLQRQGQAEAAEELYRKALSIAREQEAKLWELRAAASLTRLRRDRGRRAEARDLLASVYGWFTEGFETSDLKDAKALLDESM
jgi:predicted ATPase